MSIILMTTLFYKASILQEEIDANQKIVVGFVFDKEQGWRRHSSIHT